MAGASLAAPGARSADLYTGSYPRWSRSGRRRHFPWRKIGGQKCLPLPDSTGPVQGIAEAGRLPVVRNRAGYPSGKQWTERLFPATSLRWKCRRAGNRLCGRCPAGRRRSQGTGTFRARLQSGCARTITGAAEPGAGPGVRTHAAILLRDATRAPAPARMNPVLIASLSFILWFCIAPLLRIS